MSETIKNQQNILDKLRIKQLNPMQIEAQEAIQNNTEIILLSPTGTGKTLAFFLPVLQLLKRDINGIQALIVVPSRELAIQIEQVIREMGTGFKANAVYGGRSASKDRMDLSHLPAILIGTPGRIADHIRRETFSTESIHVLILDEFDKSLEIGFEDEMHEIVTSLPNINKKILTSATMNVKIPNFMDLDNPIKINYLKEGVPNLKIQIVLSDTRDKLDSLSALLMSLGDKPGLVFCNLKESIQEISEYLETKNISHGCFFGGMEQHDRERALIKFRNGTYQLIVATDLAARGLDIPEIQFIIHYQLPNRSHEFIHRNGRTARMHSEGTAYILQSKNEPQPEYISTLNLETIDIDSQDDHIENENSESVQWTTLIVSGGRKDKISKGDIAGLFFKQGGLEKDQLGNIELKQDCAFVAVQTSSVNQLIQKIDNVRLKTKKVRIRIV